MHTIQLILRTVLTLVTVALCMLIMYWMWLFPIVYVSNNYPISLWIGLPLVMIWTIPSVWVSTMPMSLFNRLKKNKNGFIGRLYP
jgi:hypothetical protein